MQLHVFHGSAQLLLQVPVMPVRSADGSVLGLPVRLPRLLPHLVLHTDAACAQHPPHQRAQVFDARARGLPRPVLRDVRPLVQQDRRQKRVVEGATPPTIRLHCTELSRVVCGALRYLRQIAFLEDEQLVSSILHVFC